jgi:dihydrofolate reductase
MRGSIPVALVVAMAQNRVIGRDGGLPWRLSSDLRWFKTVTMGKPVIMGRTTWESIGRPLPGRENIVLSRQPGFAPEGARLARSLEEALAAAGAWAEENGAEEICVIGGGAVYREALPQASVIHLTLVEAEVEGDTLFPRLRPEDWHVERVARIEPSEKDDHPARIERWVRKG